MEVNSSELASALEELARLVEALCVVSRTAESIVKSGRVRVNKRQFDLIKHTLSQNVNEVMGAWVDTRIALAQAETDGHKKIGLRLSELLAYNLAVRVTDETPPDEAKREED